MGLKIVHTLSGRLYYMSTVRRYRLVQETPLRSGNDRSHGATCLKCYTKILDLIVIIVLRIYIYIIDLKVVFSFLQVYNLIDLWTERYSACCIDVSQYRQFKYHNVCIVS